jgi:hypothetical protein
METGDCMALPIEVETKLEIVKEVKLDNETMNIDTKEIVEISETPAIVEKAPELVVIEEEKIDLVDKADEAKEVEKKVEKEEAEPKENRFSKRVALLDASLPSTTPIVGFSWVAESASLVEKLEYCYPESLERAQEDDEFISGVWRNMGTMKGRRRKRKRASDNDLFLLPNPVMTGGEAIVWGWNGKGGVLDLQREILVRLFSFDDGGIVIWGLEKRQEVLVEVVRLVARLEACDAGVDLIENVEVVLGIVEVLAHFLPRRSDAVSGLELEAKIEGVDGWDLSRLFLKYWIELKRGIARIDGLMLLTRMTWIEAKLEKREMMIEEAVAGYEKCALLRAGFESWTDDGNPFLMEISNEGIQAEIRKLEARRYVILDPALGDSPGHQSRMIKILCPGKLNSVEENEENRIIVDAREFMYSECGVMRRSLLRASVRGQLETAEAILISIADFLDVVWNMDDSRIGDAIFVKVG